MGRTKKKAADPGREPLAEDILQEHAEELQAYGLTLIRNAVTNQRALAQRLGWPPTTLNEVVHGRIPLDFRKWAQICYALSLDPVDALIKGREMYRADKEERRHAGYREMLDKRDLETIVSLARELSADKRREIAARIMEKKTKRKTA